MIWKNIEEIGVEYQISNLGSFRKKVTNVK